MNFEKPVLKNDQNPITKLGISAISLKIVKNPCYNLYQGFLTIYRL
jgi:hypothetical protein